MQQREASGGSAVRWLTRSTVASHAETGSSRGVAAAEKGLEKEQRWSVDANQKKKEEEGRRK
jgi:hypothetical protein